MLDRLGKLFAHFYQYVVVVMDESLLRPFEEDSREIRDELQAAFEAI